MAGADEAVRLAEAQQVRAFLQGALFGAILRSDFPVKVRDFEEWFDDEDNIKSFSIVTESGLRFHVKVEFEGEEP